MSELEQPSPTGISRRTVTKAMAWAVPVVAIAAPVPAFAGASQGTVTLTGAACKLPGNSSAPYDTNGAVYLFTITNTTASSSTVIITGVSRSGSINTNVVFSAVQLTGAGPCCTQIGKTITVAANSSNTYALVTGGWDNSSNGTLTVNYSVGGNNQTPATTTPNSLNPMGTNTPCSVLNGSCDTILSAYQFCIAKAINVPNCTTGTCS